MSEALDIQVKGIVQGVGSVSYTHLDVYKRQLPVTAPIRAAVISTTMSSTHIRGMTQSVATPNFAPTVE